MIKDFTVLNRVLQQNGGPHLHQDQKYNRSSHSLLNKYRSSKGITQRLEHFDQNRRSSQFTNCIREQDGLLVPQQASKSDRNLRIPLQKNAYSTLNNFNNMSDCRQLANNKLLKHLNKMVTRMPTG